MPWDGAIPAVSWPRERTLRALAAAQGKASDQVARRRHRAASGAQSERRGIAIQGNRYAQGHVEADTSSLGTTDADGTRHEIRVGDTFVLPKEWVGTWDMKAHFKKIIVNF